MPWGLIIGIGAFALGCSIGWENYGGENVGGAVLNTLKFGVITWIIAFFIYAVATGATSNWG